MPKVSEYSQRRVDALPIPIQDLGWKAQITLNKRFRRLTASIQATTHFEARISRE
jgi:hypothetical protein